MVRELGRSPLQGFPGPSVLGGPDHGGRTHPLQPGIRPAIIHGKSGARVRQHVRERAGPSALADIEVEAARDVERGGRPRLVAVRCGKRHHVPGRQVRLHCLQDLVNRKLLRHHDFPAAPILLNRSVRNAGKLLIKSPVPDISHWVITSLRAPIHARAAMAVSCDGMSPSAAARSR